MPYLQPSDLHARLSLAQSPRVKRRGAGGLPGGATNLTVKWGRGIWQGHVHAYGGGSRGS